MQGAICTSSMRFKQVQERCGEVCHMSSMCLNHPELVHKHSAHLVSHRTSSNLHEPHHHRNSKVCRGLSHEFGVVRLYRTFTMYIVTGEQGVQGAYAIVRGGSSSSNLIEPT